MSNSTRKCKQCGEYQPAESGVKTPVAWFCCHDHAISFAREKAVKAAQRQAAKRRIARDKEEMAARAEMRKRKADVKPIGYWMKRAQVAFNAWIRARDEGQPCISCGRFHAGQNHAGHYRPAGSNPELRFDPENCHLQCQPCNSHLSGNLTNYRPALIAKIGVERVEWLEGHHEPKRYRREDYQAIEAEYKSKLKKLLESRNDQH
ncbi:MAG: recombination protein NinG [Aeromonas sp.]